MKEVWRIASSDILNGRRLLLASAVLGASLPLVVAPTRYSADVVGLVLALALGHGVALLAGAAMVHAPLREGRLGFYFNRPITEGGLWWGKWLGNALLALLVKSVVLLPAVVWTALQGTATRDLFELSALSAAVLPFSVLAGHTLAALLGAPGLARWVNLALGLSVFSLVTWSSGLLASANAVGALFKFEVWTVLALVIGVLVGGWRQLRQGRVEAARGQRAFSLTLWISVGAAALLGSGFTHWVLNLDPDRMALSRFEAGSQTPWFIASFQGTAWQDGIAALLLVDAETGAWRELDRNPGVHLPARMSSDGQRVLWTSYAMNYRAMSKAAKFGTAPETHAWFMDLSEAGVASRRRLPESLRLSEVDSWELSPEGNRVLDVHFRRPPTRRRELDVRVRVWNVETGDSVLEEWLTVPKLGASWTPSTRVFWNDEETARLFLLGRELTLWSVDVDRHSVERTSSITVGDENSPVITSNPGLAVRYRQRSGVRSGGVAIVRFSPRGEMVLVGSRVSKDADPGSGARTAAGPPLSKRTYVALYDGRLCERKWSLDPLDDEVTALHLVGEKAIATTTPHDMGVVFGPGGTGSLRLHIGGAEGWDVSDLPAWGVIGDLESLGLLAIRPDGTAAALRDDRLEDLPPGLARLEQGYAGVAFDWGWGRSFPWGIDGGEPIHPKVGQLLFRVMDSERQGTIRRSLLRHNPEHRTVDPLF